MSETECSKIASQVCIDVALEITTQIKVIDGDKPNFMDYVPIIKHLIVAWEEKLRNASFYFNEAYDPERSATVYEISSDMNQLLCIDTVLWLALGPTRVITALNETCSRLFDIADTNATLDELIGAETPDLTEAEINKIFKKVSNIAPENDKMAWRRLRRELTKNLDSLDELNTEYFAIQAKRKPILDHIDELRAKMITECVHPADELVYKNSHVLCKFCNKRLRLLNG